MNVRLKNGLLIAAVAALTIFPLMTIRQTTSGPGERTEIFKGSDSQATAVIQGIAPDYKPWYQAIIKPPSGEIESLLFALQAALGAGFIGYYAGCSRGRARKNSTQAGTGPDKLVTGRNEVVLCQESAADSSSLTKREN